MTRLLPSCGLFVLMSVNAGDIDPDTTPRGDAVGQDRSGRTMRV